MSSRRTLVCLLVLVGVVLLTVPATAEAGVFDRAWDGPEPAMDGLLERLLQWVSNLWQPQPDPFVAQEGASITGNG